jgi:hypothetical protein
VTHYGWEICGDPLGREAQVAQALELRAGERGSEPQWSVRESS